MQAAMTTILKAIRELLKQEGLTTQTMQFNKQWDSKWEHGLHVFHYNSWLGNLFHCGDKIIIMWGAGTPPNKQLITTIDLNDPTSTKTIAQIFEQAIKEERIGQP